MSARRRAASTARWPAIDRSLARAFIAHLEEERRATRRYKYLAELGPVLGLAQALEIRCAESAGHCDRVSRTSRLIAQRLGMHADIVEQVGLGAYLHDVGKVGVSDSILWKRHALDRGEVVAMRQHPAVGSRMLEALELAPAVRTLVLHHHERFDGTGYPDALAGRSIPAPARIVAVADALDAMTSDRPYRGAMSGDEAAARLREGAGSQFDPEIVTIVIDLMDNHDVEVERGV